MHTHAIYEKAQAAFDAEPVDYAGAMASLTQLASRPYFASSVALAMAVCRADSGIGDACDVALRNALLDELEDDDEAGDSAVWAVCEDLYAAMLLFANDGERGYWSSDFGDMVAACDALDVAKGLV